MMEILKYLPILGILILSNILLGTIYNMNVQEMDFDKYKFLNGIKKAATIAVSFVALAVAFDKVDISMGGNELLSPQLIMTTAIGTYAGKVVMNLTKILGISRGE